MPGRTAQQKLHAGGKSCKLGYPVNSGSNPERKSAKKNYAKKNKQGA